MKVKMTTVATAKPPYALRAWMVTLSVACIAYGRSSMNRLAGGDSGELQAEACVGGVAHPPGYPLLLLLLRAARWISSYVAPATPFVLVANNLNALCAASAAACITEVVVLIAGDHVLVEAIAAGLIFAFSALTWAYALGLEVFALNNLLVGLLLVCFVRHFVRPRSTRNLCIGALLCGLGLANQHTIVLFEIPMILWIIATTRLRALEWIYLSASFVVGLSPYIYTFTAALTPTQGSWGDTSTLAGLWTHVFRREYGTFQLSPLQSRSDTFLSRLSFYFFDTVNEFTSSSAAFALLGVGSGLFAKVTPTKQAEGTTKGKGDSSTTTASAPSLQLLSLALLVVFSIYVIVFNALANLPLGEPLTREITRRFFLQSNTIVAVWSGLGLSFLHNHARFPGASRLVQLTALALVTHQSRRNLTTFTTSSVAQNDVVRGFGSSILDSLPNNAILLSYTDIQWNSVRYLQQCEHQRRDVVHLNLQIMAFPWFQRQQRLYPTVQFPKNLPDISTNRSSQGYATYLSRFILANLRNRKKSSRKIFLDLHGVDEATISSDQLLFGHLQVLPHGLVWHVVQSTSSSPDSSKRLQASWQQHAQLQPDEQPEATDLLRRCCGLSTRGHAIPLQIPRGSWEFAVVSIVHDAMYQRGLARLGFWLTHGAQVKSMEQLRDAVMAHGDIQRELNDLVLAGVKAMHGAISYDLYAVEKNAVVSRQRFQLYLEALADMVETTTTAADAVRTSPQLKNYVEKRSQFRRETIAQVSSFLPVMEEQHDDDVAALRGAIQTLQMKEDAAATALPVPPQSTKKSKKKKKKKGKKARE